MWRRPCESTTEPSTLPANVTGLVTPCIVRSPFIVKVPPEPGTIEVLLNVIVGYLLTSNQLSLRRSESRSALFVSIAFTSSVATRLAGTSPAPFVPDHDDTGIVPWTCEIVKWVTTNSAPEWFGSPVSVSAAVAAPPRQSASAQVRIVRCSAVFTPVQRPAGARRLRSRRISGNVKPARFQCSRDSAFTAGCTPEGSGKGVAGAQLGTGDGSDAQ